MKQLSFSTTSCLFRLLKLFPEETVIQIIYFLGLAKVERSSSEASLLPNWAVSVLPMPPPLKKRPNVKPEAKPPQPQQQELSMAELILQNALQMSALANNPNSDFSQIYKELFNNLQRQQQANALQPGFPYLDPSLFIQNLSRVRITKLMCA